VTTGGAKCRAALVAALAVEVIVAGCGTSGGDSGAGPTSQTPDSGARLGLGLQDGAVGNDGAWTGAAHDGGPASGSGLDGSFAGDSGGDGGVSSGNDSGAASGDAGCPPCGPCSGTSTHPVTDIAPAMYPTSVAVDATSVYWIAGPGSNGTIEKAPLGGGNPATLVTTSEQPHGLVLDAAHLYWTTQIDGAVHRAALDGSNPAVLSSQSGWFPYAIALGGGTVYWSWGGQTSPPNGGIMASTGVGATFTLVSGVWPNGLGVDATGVYFLTFPTSPTAPALTKSLANTLARVPLAGGTPAVLVSGLDLYARQGPLGSLQVVVDASQVFFADNGGMRRLDLAANVATVLSPQAPPTSFAVDANNVYGVFACEGVNTGWENTWVAVLPRAGGSWTPLVTAAPYEYYSSIAVDGASIYWTTSTGIKKVAKP
jgi:hypothetical protein